jgi:hypothetical protein
MVGKLVQVDTARGAPATEYGFIMYNPSEPSLQNGGRTPFYIRYHSQFDANKLWLVGSYQGTTDRELITDDLTSWLPQINGQWPRYDVTLVIHPMPLHDPCTEPNPSNYYYFDWEQEWYATPGYYGPP